MRAKKKTCCVEAGGVVGHAVRSAGHAQQVELLVQALHRVAGPGEAGVERAAVELVGQRGRVHPVVVVERVDLYIEERK